MDVLLTTLVPMGIWDSIMSFGGSIMYPLYWAVSGLLVAFHWVWAFVFGADSGATWTLSIISLTVFIRVLLIPIFVKQIRSSRNMQLVQPKLRELQKKYSHDRERLGQETMKLYRDEGINPMASCLPLLLQMPIFLALFQVLVGAANYDGSTPPRGYWLARNPELATSLSNAKFLGAKISDRFLPFEWPLTQVHLITIVLIIGMTVTLFITQLQLMRKNMPPEALTGPMAQQQKMMLYLFPVIFAVGGVNFPIGVLIYWLTSNLWTMGQQFYIIRKNPAPGTPAYEAWEERQRKHGRDPEQMAAERAEKARKQRKGGAPAGPAPEPEADTTSEGAPSKPRAARQTKGSAVRSQPQRKSRASRQPTSKKTR